MCIILISTWVFQRYVQHLFLITELLFQQASCILALLKYVLKLQESGNLVSAQVNSLFDGELNPVAPKAQRKVPVPEG